MNFDPSSTHPITNFRTSTRASALTSVFPSPVICTTKSGTLLGKHEKNQRQVFFTNCMEVATG